MRSDTRQRRGETGQLHGDEASTTTIVEMVHAKSRFQASFHQSPSCSTKLRKITRSMRMCVYWFGGRSSFGRWPGQLATASRRLKGARQLVKRRCDKVRIMSSCRRIMSSERSSVGGCCQDRSVGGGSSARRPAPCADRASCRWPAPWTCRREMWNVMRDLPACKVVINHGISSPTRSDDGETRGRGDH